MASQPIDFADRMSHRVAVTTTLLHRGIGLASELAARIDRTKLQR